MAINFQEELIRVDYVIGEDTITETITRTVEIPQEKPPAERIIDATVEITNRVTEIEPGGVNLTGDIEPAIIYVAETVEGDQPVHFVGGEDVEISPLVNFVDIPEVEEGMNIFSDVNIRRVSFNLVNDREIELTIVLTKFVKVTEFRQITVITDVTDIPEENIEEQLLRIDEVIGEETVTTTVTGTVEVPEEKPPIERIINVTGDIIGTTAEIQEDSVIVDADIDIGVIYVAETVAGDQPVHFLEGEIDLTEALDIPGVMEDMNIYTNLRIRRVSFDFINEDEVEVDVVVEIFAKVTQPRQVTVITDIIDDRVELEREFLRVEEVIGEDTVFETLTRTFAIPEEKPDVERVIEAEASVLPYTETVERDGVVLEGEIEVGLIYVADEEGQPVHFASRTFNFDNFIDIPGAQEDMRVHSELAVQRVSFNSLNVRTVEVTVVYRKFVKVTEYIQKEIVSDLVVIAPVVDDECPPSYVVYVIQPGDTLWKIARRYSTTVDAIRKANPKIDPQNLQVGQKICIPEKIIDPKG